MDALRREHVRTDQLHRRHRDCGRRPHPIGERRDVGSDTLARIRPSLPIERQMLLYWMSKVNILFGGLRAVSGAKFAPISAFP